MSGMINVNGCDDPSYRYKMPRLVGKIEGRGNGIKTVIVNCSDIAQSLHRPSGQVCKFFGCELGAMSKYEEKIDRALVNGAFDTSDLQNILTKYIEKFVLCPACGNPETEMELKGKKKAATIWLNCKACGAVQEADNSHKLCTYILKEMTGPSKGSTKEEKKEEKKKRREMRKNGELNGSSENIDDAGEEKKKKKDKSKKKDKDDDSEKERRRKKKEKKKERENGEHKSSNLAPEETESSEHSADDDIQSPAMEVLTLQDDATVIDNSVKSVQGVLLRKPSLGDLVEEAKKLQVSGGLPGKDKISILFFAIVSEQPAPKIMEYLPALAKVASTREEKMQVLACLEECVARTDVSKRAATLTVVPLVLKQLYDDDVLDEEIIIEWHEGKFKLFHPRFHVSSDLSKQVKAHAQPIIDWLQEAEESGEDE